MLFPDGKLYFIAPLFIISETDIEVANNFHFSYVCRVLANIRSCAAGYEIDVINVFSLIVKSLS